MNMSLWDFIKKSLESNENLQNETPIQKTGTLYDIPEIKLNKVHKDFLRESRVEYLDSLLPPDFFEIGLVVAGGCLRNMVCKNEPISDIDCYLLTKENATQRFLKTIEDITSHPLKTVASCYDTSSVWEGVYLGKKIQVILPSKSLKIENLLAEFDFAAVQWAYDGDYLYYTDQAVVDCAKKTVTLNYIKRNEKTFERLSKYRTKGYDVDKAWKTLECLSLLEKRVKKEIPIAIEDDIF